MRVITTESSIDRASTPKMIVSESGVGLDVRHIDVDANKPAKGIHVLIHRQKHLDAYEAEYDAESVFQISEVLGYCCQCKVQCPKTEYSKDVRCKHDKRIA